MIYAIILAGGVGSRFWPLSSPSEPKQFLNLCSDRPMIAEIIHNISGLITEKNIYIATNKLYNQKIKDCLKPFHIPLKNILFEPESKNTFAPIGVLSQKISSRDPEALIVVLPCDQLIKYPNMFLRLLQKAVEVAGQGYIVTFGISPQRPETGYGYIKVKSKIKNQKSKIYKVDRFIEKPKISLAKKFIKNKRYYWNGGIFIFRSDTLLREISRFMPAAYKTIMQIKNKDDSRRLWKKLPNKSIDYAIMEKTKRMALLPADYGWVDLGSWQALRGFLKKDKDGNISRGNCISIGNKNTLVWSDNRLVAALGLDNIIIVNTKDALLVCTKDKAQDVKKIVQILKQKKFKEQI